MITVNQPKAPVVHLGDELGYRSAAALVISATDVPEIHDLVEHFIRQHAMAAAPATVPTVISRRPEGAFVEAIIAAKMIDEMRSLTRFELPLANDEVGKPENRLTVWLEQLGFPLYHLNHQHNQMLIRTEGRAASVSGPMCTRLHIEVVRDEAKRVKTLTLAVTYIDPQVDLARETA